MGSHCFNYILLSNNMVCLFCIYLLTVKSIFCELTVGFSDHLFIRVLLSY